MSYIILADDPLLDGSLKGLDAFKGYSLQVIVAILMVFAILGIIIGITTLIFKLTGLFDLKKELDAAKKNTNTATAVAPVTSREVNINDEDMMVAALVASIDYRNEVKTDVRVVSIKEIK